jgi:hypothetical protein
MIDGKEYQSIVSCMVDGNQFSTDVTRAIAEVGNARHRPLLCYVANVLNPPPGLSNGIDSRDHLPFCEMVDRVPPEEKAIDLLIATPGGQAESVGAFVNALRPRFHDVAAIIPYQAFSAGTLWVLAANNIIMDSRAVLGPIDPQVRTAEGRHVPGQALFALINDIESLIQQARAQKLPLPLAWLEILRTIDKKELGATATSSQYVAKMASEWIRDYKFRDWTTHSTTGMPVTPDEKEQRAKRIADLLCNHQYWLSHGHGIRREELMKKDLLGLKIDNLEDDPVAHRAVRRLWAVFAWLFDKRKVAKLMVSQDFFLVLQAG